MSVGLLLPWTITDSHIASVDKHSSATPDHNVHIAMRRFRAILKGRQSSLDSNAPKGGVAILLNSQPPSRAHPNHSPASTPTPSCPDGSKVWHDCTDATVSSEHPSTLTSISNLALGSQRKFEEAEAMHHQTLELRTRVLGPEHPYTLTSMGHLANVFCAQGKYKEAEAIHQQTLELRIKVLGPEHPDTLTSMGHLALVLDWQGKYEEAEVMHRQTLELRTRVLGPKHPDTLFSMGNLASVLDSQGKYEEAEPMHRQASTTIGLRMLAGHIQECSALSR